jgi:hypothetical protein
VPWRTAHESDVNEGDKLWLGVIACSDFFVQVPETDREWNISFLWEGLRRELGHIWVSEFCFHYVRWWPIRPYHYATHDMIWVVFILSCDLSLGGSCNTRCGSYFLGLLEVGLAAVWDAASVPSELQRASAYMWFPVFSLESNIISLAPKNEKPSLAPSSLDRFFNQMHETWFFLDEWLPEQLTRWGVLGHGASSCPFRHTRCILGSRALLLCLTKLLTSKATHWIRNVCPKGGPFIHDVDSAG